jgi:hypothetical protein
VDATLWVQDLKEATRIMHGCSDVFYAMDGLQSQISKGLECRDAVAFFAVAISCKASCFESLGSSVSGLLLAVSLVYLLLFLHYVYKFRLS